MQSAGEKIAFKAAVKQACINLLQQRVANAGAAMAQAQEAANQQEKSSVGDKHETSRAISQAERDMNARQLITAQQELVLLEKIEAGIIYDKAVPGAVIQLENNLFFVAAGLGRINIGQQVITAISAGSPLFHQLKMKARGDTILMNAKQLLISSVF